MFCWHKWSKWELIDGMDNVWIKRGIPAYADQIRHCEKCGKVQTRLVKHQ